MIILKSVYLKKIAENIINAQPAPAPTAPATDPNDDPEALYQQVRPLLTKMGLQNMADRMKTRIEVGQSQGKNSLYCILLRRNSEIVPDTIERIKRSNDFFSSIKWTSKAMEVYVWNPYTSPTEAPTRPGIPPAAPPAPK